MIKMQGWEKTHGNGKNWFLPRKMGKTGKIAFFQNTCLESMLNHWQINDRMFLWSKLSVKIRHMNFFSSFNLKF
jgi:hypothetical protein